MPLKPMFSRAPLTMQPLAPLAPEAIALEGSARETLEKLCALALQAPMGPALAEGALACAYLCENAPLAEKVEQWLRVQLNAQGADGSLPLYDQAGGTGRVIARMQGGVLQVLGTVSQEWLHVRYTSPEGSVTCGFASALGITWPEEISRLQVDTGGTNEKLHLRAEPSKSAESLGLYYSGAVVYALIEDSPTRGWTHVRVGENVGYMLSSQLRTPDETTPLPTGRLRQESCPFYLTATDEEPAGTLFAAAEFAVTAEQGGRCQLMLGSEANGDAEWVWVDSQYIQYGYMTVGTVAPTGTPESSPTPQATPAP